MTGTGTVWLVVAGWTAVGAGAGAAVRAASVRLAGVEGLEVGRRAWQRGGPLLLTAALFGALALQLGPQPALLVHSLWAAVLVQIIFFDAEHHLVLDRVLLPAGACAIGLSVLVPGAGWQASLIAGAVSGGLFLAAAVLGRVVLGQEALGLGDVKLAAFVGLVLGPLAGAALIAGVVLAGVTVGALLLARRKGLHDGIAYGPFLAAGALLGLFLAGRAA